jgi:hypothetical protein
MKSYFSHDEGARNDPKLVQVMMDLGHEGKSVYWDLVEMLYEQGGYLMLSQCKSYAFALRTSCELILKLVNDFDLFKEDGEKFWSESALRRLGQRNSKSEKAKASAAKRWGSSERNENALPPQSEGNAIKGKEIKGNKRKGGDVAPPPPPDFEILSEVKAPDAAPSQVPPAPPAKSTRTMPADEAPIFQRPAFNAYLDQEAVVEVFGRVNKGFYWLAISKAAEDARPKERTNDGWEKYIFTFLSNDMAAVPSKLVLATPAGTNGAGTHKARRPHMERVG